MRSVDKYREAPTVPTAHSADRKNAADAINVPWRRQARPYLILAPALLLTIGILIPFFTSMYYSLTNYSFKYPDVY